MGRRRQQAFLRESVVLFGFLNGLFLSLGVNPGATLLTAAGNLVEDLTGGSGIIRFALAWLPLVLLVVMLVVIHRRAGWLGFVAVGLAFVSGLWLLAAPTTAFALLMGALALGFFASR